MNVALFIARRYLFSKKTHHIINWVSWLSMAGIMAGTLSLTVALSVYNGLDDLIKSVYSVLDPEIKLSPRTGKTFFWDPSKANLTRQMPEVAGAHPVLQENALMRYHDKQSIVMLKGVDADFVRTSALGKHAVAGTFLLKDGDLNLCYVGRTIANALRLNMSYTEPLWIYIPRKGGNLDALNPTASFQREYTFPSGAFAVEMESDATYAFVDISLMHRLLEVPAGTVSSVEITLKNKEALYPVQAKLQKIWGEGIKVQTREEQNETLYKIMQSEKWAIFCIMAFILLIASFTATASLMMLIVEKRKDIRTLEAIGATRKQISRIFLFEGWMITIGGAVLGILAGVAVCWGQTRFKWLRLEGNFITDAYPVKVIPTDLVYVFLLVAAIGFAASYVPSYRVRRY